MVNQISNVKKVLETIRCPCSVYDLSKTFRIDFASLEIDIGFII